MLNPQDYPTVNLVVRKKTRKGLIDPFGNVQKWDDSAARNATAKPSKNREKARGKPIDHVNPAAPSVAPGRRPDISPSTKLPKQSRKSSTTSECTLDDRPPTKQNVDNAGASAAVLESRPRFGKDSPSPRWPKRRTEIPPAPNTNIPKERGPSNTGLISPGVNQNAVSFSTAKASTPTLKPAPLNQTIPATDSLSAQSYASATPITSSGQAVREPQLASSAQKTPSAHSQIPTTEDSNSLSSQLLNQALTTQLLNQAFASQMFNLAGASGGGGGGIPGLVSPLLNPLLSSPALADSLLLNYHLDQIQQVLKRSNAAALPQLAASNPQSAAASFMSPNTGVVPNPLLTTSSTASLLSNPLLNLMQPMLLAQGLSALTLQQSQQGALVQQLLQQQSGGTSQVPAVPQPVVSVPPPEAPLPKPPSPVVASAVLTSPHQTRSGTPGVVGVDLTPQYDAPTTSASSNEEASSSSPTEILSSPTSVHYNEDHSQPAPRNLSSNWLPNQQDPGQQTKDPWPAPLHQPSRVKSFGRGRTIPDDEESPLEAGSNSPRTPVGWVSSNDALRDQSQKTDMFQFPDNRKMASHRDAVNATDDSNDGFRNNESKSHPDYSVVPEAEWGGTVVGKF